MLYHRDSRELVYNLAQPFAEPFICRNIKADNSLGQRCESCRVSGRTQIARAQDGCRRNDWAPRRQRSRGLRNQGIWVERSSKEAFGKASELICLGLIPSGGARTHHADSTPFRIGVLPKPPEQRTNLCS